jgi:hypothetical protein
VQTAYRDSAAQTAPYAPATHPLAPGAAPEVSRLGFLTFGGSPGRSLPAGRADVESVEAARARAHVEAVLPPMTDEASFALRRRLMEGVALAAAARKEAEMEERDAASAGIIAAAVAARASERSFANEQRLEALRRQLGEAKATALDDIEAKRAASLRKLARARLAHNAHIDMLTGTGTFAGMGAAALASGGSALGRKKVARDVISDFANHGSVRPRSSRPRSPRMVACGTSYAPPHHVMPPPPFSPALIISSFSNIFSAAADINSMLSLPVVPQITLSLFPLFAFVTVDVRSHAPRGAPPRRPGSEFEARSVARERRAARHRGTRGRPR